MNDAISVGAPFRTWWFVLAGAGALLLAVAGALVVPHHFEIGVCLFIAAGAGAFATAVVAIVFKRQRCLVTVLGDGFVVWDRHGERTYDDAQIICASLYSRSNYVNGEFQSISRTFDVWMDSDDGPQRIRMLNRFHPGEGDPLKLLIARLLNLLYERARATLTSAQPFEGEQWTLYPSELVVHQRRNTCALRLDDLAAVAVFDQDLCVWAHDCETPAVRIPIKGANAHVLLRLLSEHVEPHESRAGLPVAGNGLGRVLFERRPGKGAVFSLWALPIIAFVCLVGGLGMAMANLRIESLLLLGTVCLVLLLIWLVPLSQHVTFRCHERGLCRKWLWRETRIRYEEVSSFTYNAVRQFVKGVYSGTHFSLTFFYESAGKMRKLTYAKTIRNADDELENLRDRISSVLAARMAAAFSQCEVVPWTPSLRFLPEGLEYRPSGLLGRKSPVIIGFETIGSFDIQQGTFYLWTTGKTQPAIKESVGELNFFPGYFLLTMLSASHYSLREPSPA
jgi:hypothetical protein